MGDVTNGTLMGVAGAGAGYYVATQKTAGMAEQAAQLAEEAKLLKQPIVDKFAKHGYTEGMDISKAANEKVKEAIQKGWQENGVKNLSGNKKALDKIWNKTHDYLTKMETTFKTEMAKLDKPAQEVLNNMKNIKIKHTAIGAAAGVGVYLLCKGLKSVFGGKQAQ